ERTRLQAYPELLLGGRPYATGPAWEAVCWDHRAALERLGRVPLRRKVDKDGCVSLYDHRQRVAWTLRGRDVEVQLAVSGPEWVFRDQGQEVGRGPAAYLSAQAIRSLEVRRRPGRSARDTQQRRLRQGLALADALGEAAPATDPPS